MAKNYPGRTYLYDDAAYIIPLNSDMVSIGLGAFDFNRYGSREISSNGRFIPTTIIIPRLYPYPNSDDSFIHGLTALTLIA